MIILGLINQLRINQATKVILFPIFLIIFTLLSQNSYGNFKLNLQKLCRIMDFNSLKSLLKRDRSIRQYNESRRVTEAELFDIVSLTRYCASGRNLQPLRYRMVISEEECERIFPLLAWAGYYKHWDGPESGKRPAAYIIQCIDSRLCKSAECDCGLSLQAITLGAVSKGLGCCIIKSFDPEKVKSVLGLPEWCVPVYVISLGYPAEKAVVTEVDKDGDIKYFRDRDGVQCVPKRRMDDLMIY